MFEICCLLILAGNIKLFCRTGEIDAYTAQLKQSIPHQQQFNHLVRIIPDHLRIGIARNLLKQSNSNLALSVLKNHHIVFQRHRHRYIEIEWFIGFLELVYHHNPFEAISRFQNIIFKTHHPSSQTKIAFWMSKAFSASGNKSEATHWLKYASHFSSSFYGQLAQFSLQKAQASPTYTPIKHHTLFDNPIPSSQVPLLDTIVFNLLNNLPAKYDKTIWNQFLDSYKHTHSYLERVALLKTAYCFHSRLSRELYKQWFKDYRIASFLGYPLLQYILPDSLLEKIIALLHLSPTDAIFLITLAHAVILQESEFNLKNIKSPSNAVGIMQLKEVISKSEFQQIVKSNHLRHDLPCNLSSLFDNLAVGISFLKTLTQKFNYYLPLIAAAYNAGEKKIDEWIETFGDPRSNNITPLIWIELIPFEETREYVKKVIEAFIVYSHLLNAEYLQYLVYSLF